MFQRNRSQPRCLSSARHNNRFDHIRVKYDQCRRWQRRGLPSQRRVTAASAAHRLNDHPAWSATNCRSIRISTGNYWPTPSHSRTTTRLTPSTTPTSPLSTSPNLTSHITAKSSSAVSARARDGINRQPMPSPTQRRRRRPLGTSNMAESSKKVGIRGEVCTWKRTADFTLYREPCTELPDLHRHRRRRLLIRVSCIFHVYTMLSSRVNPCQDMVQDRNNLLMGPSRYCGCQ